MNTYKVVSSLLARLRDSASTPKGAALATELRKTIDSLNGLSDEIRPAADSGMPGSLISLKSGLPTLIIPDLHGRRDFLYNALTIPLVKGDSFLRMLAQGTANVVCVGDAFHGEARVRGRWSLAYVEFMEGFVKHGSMDQEMSDNLRLLQMILVLLQSFPENFFFLKGNHENIANEMGEGNYPFRKFVNEGEMVKVWTEKFLGKECFDLIYDYEKTLPLAAVGERFLVTHAEPVRTFSRKELINAYEDDEVLYGLTWTDNEAAEEGSVEQTLDNLFPDHPSALCFGGHRPVNGLYALRASDRYIQINHPSEEIAAVVFRGEDFIPHKQIIRISRI